jgi:DNA-binding transcriptional LysR family regulator
MKVISRAPGVLLASPKLLAARGAPEGPQALSAYPTVGMTDMCGPERWVLRNVGGEEVEVVHEPRLSSGSPSIVRQAAADGVGVAVLPEWSCREMLESGQLVRILPDWTRREGLIHIVFTSRRGQLPGVRAVIDFLAEALDPRAPAWDAAL